MGILDGIRSQGGALLENILHEPVCYQIKAIDINLYPETPGGASMRGADNAVCWARILRNSKYLIYTGLGAGDTLEDLHSFNKYLLSTCCEYNRQGLCSWFAFRGERLMIKKLIP